MLPLIPGLTETIHDATPLIQRVIEAQAMSLANKTRTDRDEGRLAMEAIGRGYGKTSDPRVKALYGEILAMLRDGAVLSEEDDDDEDDEDEAE